MRLRFSPEIVRKLDQCTDPHSDQGGDRLSLALGLPRGPAARMQPGMAGRLDAMGKQRVVRIMAVAAGEAASGRRAHEVAVQPFGNAAGEGTRFGFAPRQLGLRLGDARPLLEEGEPLLG